MSSTKKKKKKEAVSIRIPAADPQQKLIRLLGYLVAALAVIEYIQTAGFGFALDDYSAILENKVTQGGFHTIPLIFKTAYRFGYPLQGDELYRPIPKAIFAILWQLFPNNSIPGHLLNIGLYAFSGMLLFKVLAEFLPQNIYLAFYSSLLFIVHPIHTEVVANIKSLDEILSFFFFLCSIFYLQKYFSVNRLALLIAAALFYFAALLSKESSVTFLAIYPVMFYFLGMQSLSKIFSAAAIMIIPAFIFIAIHYKVVGLGSTPSMADNVLVAAGDIVQKEATAIYILGLYLKLLIFPHPLTFDYSFNQIPLITVSDWRFWISLSVYLSIFIYAVSKWKKKRSYSLWNIFFPDHPFCILQYFYHHWNSYG